MRKKFMVYGLWFIVLLLILIPSTINYLPFTIYAADSTPSADPLRQSDSEASIKAKLEELKKEIASKAAKLKQEISSKLQNKAYIGTIKTKSQNSLTLATRTGPKIVNINQDTVFESKIKRKQKFSQKTSAEEDYLAALGDIDENGVLTAKKVILLPASPRGEPTTNYQPKTYLWGQVISISDRLVTIKNRDLKNIAVSISSVNIPNLKTSNFVILTGNFNKNEIFEAEFIYVIPQGGILKPKRIATPSAQIKPATPSGKKR